MAMTSADTQTFLKNAYNFKDVTTTTASELKCFKCGKRARQSSSYVICTSNITTHRMTNLDYIITLADMYEGYTRAFENEPNTNGKQIV